MSNEWKMLTLVGEDQPGIVAQVTDRLYRNGWTLGEASMIRLGGNFTIMMMISGSGAIDQLLAPVADALHLRLHLDEINGGLHQHRLPNIQVRVVGADRTGIVAQVTQLLLEHKVSVLELESDVAGTEQQPLYIMQIQGYIEGEIEPLASALAEVDDVDVSVSAIDTLIG